MILRCIFFCAAMMLALTLAGCHPPQQVQPARLGLRLEPAALGASISLQQRLAVEREGRIDYLEAALEVDDRHVGMIGLALGQRVMSLEFDGNELKSWRHALLPEQVRAEDVLEDIQLTYWPAAAVRAALPTGWRIEEEGMRRTIWSDDAKVVVINYSAEPRWNGKVALTNLRYQYQLTIQSAPAGP
ncbi:DUF3261 domain-containing protein [Noviherbaspirillum sedimenti]|uniref:DUF3261 domain-containing protein n=1 Tax=Noviherbaspirillum sedimenti TaxID=2320865 RepID=A0A3A3G2Q0_9BURK|nr:DUF3261 domain-containing protein [Noviherbaspirillum sedimenti]RJG02747.1 DUF3261 domain-containing protein [Noviherbaspirillum sedimenti]